MGSLFSRLRKNENRFLAVESDEKAGALGFWRVAMVLVHRNSAMILNIDIIHCSFPNCCVLPYSIELLRGSWYCCVVRLRVLICKWDGGAAYSCFMFVFTLMFCFCFACLQ